ncbi:MULTISPECIES: DegT/DnrJ/EryC1/StrS family aminotransferase [Thalassospira]|uniref:PLP-dependent enzyme possibly involved in cell wall biogenesis n=2 Tax=Thalassospira TaxID=168934 RepID=A0AB72U6Z9_9PROT|nr:MULTISPECIES: DegT/DnrJ/EryC1/StrS family aminotransferase [Thalassospira]AJD50140.1 putative PLP-dependent enzyme possibly involved in cell wall biogenesis [Thalassospira xiamenensis M-5 = DSM 17429]KEO57896.1 glutamine--scyllo-inositol aminotransferase [Thalassospira permensis NBRC 106175]SIT27827.1 perosamine synthetase [Thalassospira xiamenensis M-5 = DSM 17429]
MIPVFEPIIGEEEISYVTDALRKGELSGTFGHYLEAFEAEFAAFCGCEYGVAVSNGTTALHLAVAAAGIQPGEEVLISASTNIATALAVAHNNAIPVPVDSEEGTWNLDLDLIESLITPKTKAIIPVHLFGHPVDMDALMAVARKHDLIVIEDCAEAHGATCRGRKTGGFGDMGCFSFYANKVITTGEGGMVVTNDKALAERLRLLRNLAFTTPRFRHEELGYNFRMTGYQAAMGLAQLHRIEHIVDEKRRVAHTYNSLLEDIPGLLLPVEKEWAHNVYWMYAVVIGDEFGMSRDQLSESLRAHGIDTRTFFCPMNQQPCLQEIPGFKNVSCPVADRIWENGLYLPSTHNLTEGQLAQIAKTLSDLQGGLD